MLPFVNLSSDKENEFFSDGVTEEVINALANVEGVRVVARTSAFSYKCKSVNVRQIGEELNVATVLDGTDTCPNLSKVGLLPRSAGLRNCAVFEVVDVITNCSMA